MGIVISGYNASVSLGIASVISWAVAEVPQIITNYREKSTDGLSVAFLMTWIVGDLFNIAGCLLEPTTLPTQYWMAVLYTALTAILTVQTIYYGHIYHCLKVNKASFLQKSSKLQQEDPFIYEKLIEPGSATTTITIPATALECPRADSSETELRYASARSLLRSPMRITKSWLTDSYVSGRTPPADTHNWSSNDSPSEPLLGGLVPTKAAHPSNIKNTLSVISFAAFFLGVYVIHLTMSNSLPMSPPGTIIVVGRKLLQEKTVKSVVQEGSKTGGIGSFFGWAMAVIYLGGRVPQIWLNMRRGNVKGLNPLMFIFALIGNLTYLGSILLSRSDWSGLVPNLPWLVDAGGCALLDAFILIQFAYFRYQKPKVSKSIDYPFLA